MTTEDLKTLTDTIAQLVSVLALSGVIGVAVNPVVSYIKTALSLNEPGRVTLKRIIAVLTSIVGGVVAVSFLNAFVVTSIVTIGITSVLIFVAATIFYQNFWKESDAIKKIEGTY